MNDNYVVQWDNCGDGNRILTVLSMDKVILYRNTIPERDFKMYNIFIKERLNLLLQDCGKLDKPYVMFELGGMMWGLDDDKDHRMLTRSAFPLFYKTEESVLIDFIFDSTLHDLFTYEKDILVFRFDKVFINGRVIDTYESFTKHTGITTDKLYIISRSIEFKLKRYVVDKIGSDLKGVVTEDSQCWFD